jgi:hypothetical protein
MHTKDLLADELRKVGLTVMAEQAATGYYHDFLSPLDLPEMQLVEDLADMAAVSTNREDILELRARVINGDFDASIEESEEWAASQDGQDTFRKLSQK